MEILAIALKDSNIPIKTVFNAFLIVKNVILISVMNAFLVIFFIKMNALAFVLKDFLLLIQTVALARVYVKHAVKTL